MSAVEDTVESSVLPSTALPRIYDGTTVYCVGGGPSLRDFDWKRLRDKNVVAINRGMQLLPTARVIFWSDFRFWRYYGEDVLAHAAEFKITINDASVLAARKCGIELFNVPHTGCSGFEYDPRGIKHGKNSGYAAINIAAHLGAKRIVLLGYDMKWSSAATHWHDGYVTTHTEAKLDGYLAEFPGLVGPLHSLGIEVVNACEDSRIECWPRMTIDAALAL